MRKPTSSHIENNSKVMVFVSHASADVAYIKPFVEKVLKLGLELKTEEIAFTSEESYGVEPGKNIANYIKENINSALVVLLMISPNYRRSEVCLNEMGAAWVEPSKCGHYVHSLSLKMTKRSPAQPETKIENN